MGIEGRLFAALENSDVKAAKKLIAKPSFDVHASMLPPQHQVGFYPVICAVAESGLVEVAKCVLEKGANVDALVGCNGMSALYIACQEGFHDMAALLIAHKANVNLLTTDQVPSSPLHIASQYGHKRVVKLLLRNGANIDQCQTKENVSSLMLAVRCMHPDVAMLLIENGADVFIRNTNGITALIIASNRGLEPVVRALLAKGADPLQEDYIHGCSAIDYATTAGRKEIIALFKTHIAEKNSQGNSESDKGSMSDGNVSGSGRSSVLKQMAALQINLYESPLQNHEIAGGSTLIKEKKYKCCSYGPCGKTEKEHGSRLSKCDRCRCVRYCSVECQRS